MITTVRARWDVINPQRPGWYAEALRGREVATDSEKVSWSVDLDDYGEEDAEDVREALAAAYPGAEIEVE